MDLKQTATIFQKHGFQTSVFETAAEAAAYLNKEIDAYGYDLVPIGNTLIAPLTLYSQNFDSIDAIKEAAGLLK